MAGFDLSTEDVTEKCVWMTMRSVSHVTSSGEFSSTLVFQPLHVNEHDKARPCVVEQQAWAIGLRMALGASQSNVLRSILSDSLWRVCGGRGPWSSSAHASWRACSRGSSSAPDDESGRVRSGRTQTGGDGCARRVRARPMCGPARPARGSSRGIARGRSHSQSGYYSRGTAYAARVTRVASIQALVPAATFAILA
jgi:hypothetical protein